MGLYPNHNARQEDCHTVLDRGLNGVQLCRRHQTACAPDERKLHPGLIIKKG